jgi:diguanylate cyclase (GGDEF)-like protein
MRVLIAEDDAVSRKILEASLRRWGHEVIAVDNGDDAWRVLTEDDPPRIAVIDWMMPGFDGPEICEKLQRREGQPFTFVLILTAKDNTDDIVSALNAGADDYLTKPYHPQELRSRLGAGIRLVNLTLDLEAANQKLFEAAHTDFLTRIPNRNAIISRLTDQLSRSRRAGTPFVVALGDIDHFKLFNDEHGHQTGDDVLIQVARRLEDVKREYDAVGRYGGEEFLLVLDDVDEESLLPVAERFRSGVGEKPIESGGMLLRVTISIGALWVPPENTAGLDVLLHEADALLYRAKANGRNCSCTDRCRRVPDMPRAQNG